MMTKTVEREGAIVYFCTNTPREAPSQEPWAEVCCKPCWFAVEEKCTCRCRGVNHGKGLKPEDESRGKEDEREDQD